jgi:hypothetical protein
MPPETRLQKRKRLEINTNLEEEPINKKLRSYKTTPTNNNIWKVLNKLNTNYSSDIYKPDYFKWVSGSSIRNYLLRDPLVDWLDLYYDKLNYNDNPDNKMTHISSSNMSQSKSSNNILFNKGNQFESLVIEELNSKYPNNTITICKTKEDFFNKSLVDNTLKAMKDGIPIIIQAMLVNEDNLTFGVADLLVRSDYINNLFINSPNYEEEYIKAKFIDNYHYVVIDIKWSSINLCANGENILNSDRVPAYKGQLAIYNLALGNLQGYIPNKTFILGKGWKWNSKSLAGYNCLERCGVINYLDFDNHYIKFTADAVNWLRDVRYNGHKWSCLKPSRPEMYPNMCFDSDSKWNKIKQDLADKLSELTKLWMVGTHNRDYAHSHNIYKWSDPKCSANSLNINGKKIGPIVDKLIEINRDSNSNIYPCKINDNTNNWQNKNKLDFYVDFETINDVFMRDSMNIKNSHCHSDICFRIAVGYEEDNKYKTISFTMNQYNLEEEKRIFQEFKNFIEDKTQKYMKQSKIKNRSSVTPRLFHWAVAEQTFINHANIRHNNFLELWLKHNIIFIDMCKIFITEPIIIKGMFKFKLKEVASAMYKHGMIKTKWNNDITDGLTAMYGATEYYKNKDNNIQLMKKIEEYNDIDVKVLWEIVQYLRGI